MPWNSPPPELWEHQKQDIKFCIDNPIVFNTSDPGVGKTRVCLETIRSLQLPTLIIAPKSILVPAWAEDILKYTPELTYSVAYASNRRAAFTEGNQIVITNHDATKWLVDNLQYLERFRDGLLIVDESTAVKNHKAQRSEALDAIRNYFSRCILMSGTPNPNGVCDLWHQLYILDRGARLGRSFYKFRSTVCTPCSRGAFTEWVEKPGALDVVASLFSDITIRHSKDDCLDLPENHVYTTELELPVELMTHYIQMKNRARIECRSNTITAVNAAVLVQKLLQIASGAVYDDVGDYQLLDDSRYEFILDLVEARSHSLVAFIWRHQRDQLVLGAKKRKLPYAIFDGTVSDKARENAVDDFQAGKLRVLFAHPQSAGHGLTLTKGIATIWSSPTYNLGHFAQFNARIYRGGQTQKTETILVSAKQTADSKAYAQLLSKNENMVHLLDLLTL